MDRGSFLKRAGGAIALLFLPARAATAAPERFFPPEAAPHAEVTGPYLSHRHDMVHVAVRRGNAHSTRMVSPELLDDTAADATAFIAESAKRTMLKLQAEQPGRATHRVHERHEYTLRPRLDADWRKRARINHRFGEDDPSYFLLDAELVETRRDQPGR